MRQEKAHTLLFRNPTALLASVVLAKCLFDQAIEHAVGRQRFTTVILVVGVQGRDPQGLDLDDIAGCIMPVVQQHRDTVVVATQAVADIHVLRLEHRQAVHLAMDGQGTDPSLARRGKGRLWQFLGVGCVADYMHIRY